MSTHVPIITLLSDFGEQDGYVASMKGVILGMVPDARLIDVTHQVNAQDIGQAASILADTYPYFPPDTVHVVVVDPGVGSQRDPIAIDTPHGRFIGPDNGVLTFAKLAAKTCRTIRLDKPEYWLPNPSFTFHGRDIFSPAAAHLVRGVPFEDLGSPLDSIQLLKVPELSISERAIRGQVARVDRFGNCLTNIMKLQWIDEQKLELHPISLQAENESIAINSQKVHVTCGWHSLDGIHKTYSEVSSGQRVAVVGSGGELEIAINQGNASQALALQVGDPVTIQFDL